MGIFSKSCEYGLRAVCYIAQRSQEGQKAGIVEISTQINSPEAFLAKLLQRLVKEGVIQSAKGPNGGFYLDKTGLKKPLIKVVEAIDGDALFKGCAMGLTQCSERNPCPLHEDFKHIRQQIASLLQKTSLGDFNEGLLNGAWRLCG